MRAEFKTVILVQTVDGATFGPLSRDKMTLNEPDRWLRRTFAPSTASGRSLRLVERSPSDREQRRDAPRHQHALSCPRRTIPPRDSGITPQVRVRLSSGCDGLGLADRGPADFGNETHNPLPYINFSSMYRGIAPTQRRWLARPCGAPNTLGMAAGIIATAPRSGRIASGYAKDYLLDTRIVCVPAALRSTKRLLS